MILLSLQLILLHLLIYAKCFAKIYLADVDKFTGQMTLKTLLDCIKTNNIKSIKAIITMYNGGFPENVLEFYKIKKKYGSFLIEEHVMPISKLSIQKNILK